MKKYLLILILTVLCFTGMTQVVITSGTQWVNNGNIVVTLQDMNLVNNGTFIAGNSIVKFTGSAGNTIGGSSPTTFYELEMAKAGSNSLSLLTDLNISNKVNFTSGLINLNQKNITLAGNAFLNNENENSRIIGLAGGEVIINLNMSNPNNLNAGNLGAFLSSTADLGAVTIRRGHVPQSGTGLTQSIQRYYSISPQNNTGLNATLRLKYFDAELNGQNETLMVIYQSNNNGIDWSNISQSIRNSNSNYIEKTGVNNLALQTLANDAITGTVTNLVFNATRKKPTEVQLNWTTQAETNMNGFEIQRRLKNEADFSVRSFVNSKALAGNSNTQLSYSYLDANSYTDTSYYRLKIVDLNGSFSYSPVKAVAAKTKAGGNGGGGSNGNNRETETLSKSGTGQASEMAAKITVGPNPNNGNFWFMVTGIEKETTATLYTIDGKILKQFIIVKQQQQKVNGLGNGMYILKVPGIEAFKIIVQGSGTPNSNNTLNQSALKY